MGDTYLDVARKNFADLQTKITKVQADAAASGKGLTEEEFRAVKTDVDAAKEIAKQIQDLTDNEAQMRAVGELAASLGTGENGDGDPDAGKDGGDGAQHRGAATTNQRDPGHYRSLKDGGRGSFFGDLFDAGHNRNADAIKRLAENTAFMRAAGPVTQASGGLGIVPPKWLTDEYLKMGRQGRVVANLVRNLPIGDDPRPLVLPKQTAQVDADMTAQTNEGANNTGWGDPLFTTNTDTLTPVANAAYQDVSRQLLAAGIPSADVLILQDLHDAWDLKVEKAVCTAIVGGTALTTFATDYSVAAGTATNTQFNYVGGAGAGSAAINAVIDGQTAVANALYGPADIAVMNYSRFGKFRKLVDLNGRPLMPVSRYSPQNAAGALDKMLVGDIEGVDAYGTNGIAGTSVPSAEKFAVLRSQAVILAESTLLEFNYEQIVGPSSVRMGIFGYFGALVRVPAAVQVFTVTAA